MPTLVIPFAGAEGKTRLHSSARIRRALAQAMLCDVVAACVLVGRTRVVTPNDDGANAAADAGAEVVADPGGGQGAAVQAGLEGVEPGGILVVNADVPCVVPHDLRSLLASTPAGCLETGGLPRARRSARRDDERGQPSVSRSFRPALRPQQFRPLPRARGVARS